jgi:hypothetical protein
VGKTPSAAINNVGFNRFMTLPFFASCNGRC